ncbi:uncharacterized protein BKCO1_37000199 [Diplodia corticola]|uniref:Uncharacterized protein n=1 Tax=Diplodia corticola TaxID=236234 RepID=A0A1J9QU58_9PEZI|nr:uncharacterized protein BKCO1_37000199 [Diplodia corticola]OJD32494.1 hypothetical protein BKCO1_37000199 [Diplodia corticola]
MGQVITKIREVAARSITWINQHPYRTAIYVINTAILVVPTTILNPLLGVLGFTSLGPAAGSIAATLHSALSPLTAGGGFSILQSAAMGGYGIGVATGVVRVGAAAMIGDVARRRS